MGPTLRVKVSDHPLRCMSVQSKGEITLLRLSQSLYEVQRNEKARCGALFERETHREKILDARQRELKLKERQRSGKGDREGDEAKKNDDEEVDLNALVQE